MDSAMEAAAEAVASLFAEDPDAPSSQFAQAAITAYLAAKEAAGFVMVPVEPTGRMVVAGANERENGDMELHARKWRAMLAARPREEDR